MVEEVRQRPDPQAKLDEVDERAGERSRSGPWLRLGKSLVHFDRRGITPRLAIRSAVTVGLLIAVGIVVDAVPQSVIAAVGALSVALSDSHEPYADRVRQLLLASLMTALAVFAGSTLGFSSILVALLLVAWAFTSGLSVALSAAAANIGRVSLATLIVFAAHPLPFGAAATMAGLAAGGGLLLTVLAAATWPFHRYAPERRALNGLYKGLGRLAADGTRSVMRPAAGTELSTAYQALASLETDDSMQSQRLRSLLRLAVQLRLNLLTLHRLHNRLRRNAAAAPQVKLISKALQLLARAQMAIGDAIMAGRLDPAATHDIAELDSFSKSLDASGADANSEVNSTLTITGKLIVGATGHLREAADLVAAAAPADPVTGFNREARKSWRQRIRSRLVALRANFTLRSTAYRHAVRLALGVGIAAAIGFVSGMPRPHWMVMATALVLMPDFSATFSRGVLRIAGSLAGVVLGTLLLQVLPAGELTQLLLVMGLMFVLRSLLTVNHGVFVAAGTALVVVLFALHGVPAEDVMSVRALNTVAGGVIALLVYWGWPTWERTQAPEALASLLDAYRCYFSSVWQALERPHHSNAAELDRARAAALRARINVEASLERARTEPDSAAMSRWLETTLPASYRFIHALFALEVALSERAHEPLSAAHTDFADAVKLRLCQLSDALRGLAPHEKQQPDLWKRLSLAARSSDSLNRRHTLVNVEADRLISSLEQLSDQILTPVAHKQRPNTRLSPFRSRDRRALSVEAAPVATSMVEHRCSCNARS